MGRNRATGRAGPYLPSRMLVLCAWSLAHWYMREKRKKGRGENSSEAVSHGRCGGDRMGNHKTVDWLYARHALNPPVCAY